MADCCLTQHTSHIFFVGLHTLYSAFFCMKMRFLCSHHRNGLFRLPGLLPPTMDACVISIAAVVGMPCFCQGRCGCGVLMQERKMATMDELTFYFVLWDGSEGCPVHVILREHAVSTHGSMIS